MFLGFSFQFYFRSLGTPNALGPVPPTPNLTLYFFYVIIKMVEKNLKAGRQIAGAPGF